MYYVYILQSLTDPGKFYTGLTDNPEQRLKDHNSGKSIHTNKFKPWKIKTYVAFRDREKAEKFEVYLKTSSGRAFAKKRL